MADNLEANNFYESDTLKLAYANRCFEYGIASLAKGDLLVAGINFIYASAFGVKEARKYLDQLYENPEYKYQISKFSGCPNSDKTDK
jgi:hypothetical protein